MPWSVHVHVHARYFKHLFYQSSLILRVAMQESKLYGAHFKEISLDAPKAKKITFDDSDDDD